MNGNVSWYDSMGNHNKIQCINWKSNRVYERNSQELNILTKMNYWGKMATKYFKKLNRENYLDVEN